MKAFFAWIRQWVKTAFEASTRVEFYRSAGARKTGEAIGHLAMLTVLWTLPLTVLFFGGLRQVTTRVAEGIRSDIPPGTVFEMKGGNLSNNLQEPLIFREDDDVIIVNTASSTLSLAEGEDGLVVSASGITQRDGARGETVSFKDIPDFKVDREGLMERIARWAPLALFLTALFVLIFVFLMFWAGILLNALMHGLVLWLLLKVIKRPCPWREAFVLAAYAATASVALRLVVQGFEPLSALPNVVYWGFIAWIAYDAYKGGVHERKQTSAEADRPHAEGHSGSV